MNSTLPFLHHFPYSSSYRLENYPRFKSHSSTAEDVFDDEDQIPTVEDFRAIVDDYLNNLSPKKRDKALVDQHRYCLIQQVLRDPRNTAISTAQFRFWVKKMFQIQPGTVDVVCHDNKPVAMKEQIYEILVKAHREAHHGGRDKTSALVRRRFSWIPKELVARFVRHCPFCITRRNNGHSPNSLHAKGSSPHLRYPRHAYSFDSGITSVCTPPSIKEDSDLSSGPPSSDSGYEATPNYVTMSTSSSPKKPYFSSMYDRDEHEFLECTPYDQSMQTSFTGHFRHDQSQRHPHQANGIHSLSNSSLPQPQSPLFYHQGYPGYSFYNTGYYPNALGITQCQENSPSSSSSTVTASNTAAAAAAAAVALMRSPVSNTSDLLSHQEQEQHQHPQPANHFTSYQPLDMTENAFGNCM